MDFETRDNNPCQNVQNGQVAVHTCKKQYAHILLFYMITSSAVNKWAFVYTESETRGQAHGSVWSLQTMID